MSVQAPPLRRFTRAVAVVSLLTAGALVLGTAAHAAIPAPPAGFTQVWASDFDGAANTGEIETMTDSTQNVYRDGSGHLIIKARHAGTNPATGWTSGRIETKATFGAGAGGVLLVKAAIWQPDVTTANGVGYWPAFWMLGSTLRTGTPWPTSGEIDIMEDVNGRSSVFGTLHCGTNPGGPCNESTGIGSGERACNGCQTGYHVYAVQVDRSVKPEQMRWYRDGTNYFTVNANQVPAATWTNAAAPTRPRPAATP
nr:hypothetical protein GCM10020063_044890 [Dactylosporangium thailandense]